MNELTRIERERNILLPQVYKDFYNLCSSSLPQNLVGTDLVNNYEELNNWAVDLLNEDKAENFLSPDHFVFMMHQGYIFWYFKADGNPDPTVYVYRENKLIPDALQPFSKFIKDYIR